MKDNHENLMDHKRAAEAAEQVREKLQQGPASTQEHILQFFSYSHLPEALAVVSRPFCDLATGMVNVLPRNPERTVALRKLLEAKDAAVRALIAE